MRTIVFTQTLGRERSAVTSVGNSSWIPVFHYGIPYMDALGMSRFLNQLVVRAPALEIHAAEAFGHFMRIRGGSVIQSLGLGFKLQIEEEPSSVLSTFLAEIESKFGSLSKEVLVPFLPDVEIDGVEFRIPVKGDKLALLQLGTRNAKELQFNTLKQREHTDPDQFYLKVMEDLRKALGMKELPRHMECFDNSNIQGTNPVASCVVFRDGKPSKKDYRRFKIKTVIGANDYASMKEVVNRRYSRMLMEAPDDLPQLVVIDGGKGQLDFAYQALAELGLTERLTVVGLAKRLEEVIRVGDPYPLFIDRNSQRKDRAAPAPALWLRGPYRRRVAFRPGGFPGERRPGRPHPRYPE